MIVSFEHPLLGDAAYELEQLGEDFACEVLLYLQKVHCKSVHFQNLALFYIWRGVEMFQALMGNKFAIFSVEIDSMGDLKITVMVAGQQGVPLWAGPLSWDGNNYTTLKSGILNERSAVWFA
jgi:hypothetical protein